MSGFVQGRLGDVGVDILLVRVGGVVPEKVERLLGRVVLHQELRRLDV